MRTTRKAGILSEDQVHHRCRAPAPRRARILSPLLANIALEVLDEHFAQVWAAISPTRRSTAPAGAAAARRVYRLVRYADDFIGNNYVIPV